MDTNYGLPQAKVRKLILGSVTADGSGNWSYTTAALANGVLESTGNLSAVHIVGQIRLAAVDLLRATGLPREEAQQAVRGAR